MEGYWIKGQYHSEIIEGRHIYEINCKIFELRFELGIGRTNSWFWDFKIRVGTLLYIYELHH